jgi:hypothetical protein
MVSLHPSSVVDHGIIGGVMVSLSETKDCHCCLAPSEQFFSYIMARTN